MFYFVKGALNIGNIYHISHMDLIDSVFGIKLLLQVKYCSWVFKTKMKFSLALNSAIVGV